MLGRINYSGLQQELESSVKTTLNTILLCLCVPTLPSLSAIPNYEPSADHPFGQANPAAPKQILDYQHLIGLSDCESETRNPDGDWKDPVRMTWRFKYIMNGMAIQDETLKNDGAHSGSIRQYSEDLSSWFVHYYSTGSVPNSKSTSTQLSTWKGGLKDGSIVLYRKQKSPTGAEGYFRLTFSNITPEHFNWIGEWVDKEEKIAFPTWRIACTQRGRR